MLDLATGSLTIDGRRFDRSTVESNLSSLGVTVLKVYQSDQTGTTCDGNLDQKVHLTFAFSPNGQLKSIIAYSVHPTLSGWGDITSQSENQRGRSNADLVNLDHPGKYTFPWGTVQLAIDPRETIAKVWIEFSQL